MVDAERRLLANALQNPDNHHFVLLSDRWWNLVFFFLFSFSLSMGGIAFLSSILTFLLFCSCVPLYSFDYIYKYLMPSNISFVDRWVCAFTLPLRVFISLWLAWNSYYTQLLCEKISTHTTPSSWLLVRLLDLQQFNAAYWFVCRIFLIDAIIFSALRIPVHMEMAGIQSTCYRKWRRSTLEKVLRYALKISIIHPTFHKFD